MPSTFQISGQLVLTMVQLGNYLGPLGHGLHGQRSECYGSNLAEVAFRASTKARQQDEILYLRGRGWPSQS